MSEKHDGDAHYHELNGGEGHKKIEELIEGQHICMMTTAAEDGSMSARPMAVQHSARFEGTLWFLTRSTSEKVDEIRDDQHILLSFAKESDQKYVSLKGRARVSRDQAKIDELWSDHYKAWFPKGKNDPEIAVLAVAVEAADYWESIDAKVVTAVKYAFAAATGRKVALGEAGHITV